MIAQATALSGPARFDEVVLQLNGEEVRYSYAAFMQLTLSERIRSILTGKPEFLLRGREVPRAEALALGPSKS